LGLASPLITNATGHEGTPGAVFDASESDSDDTLEVSTNDDDDGGNTSTTIPSTSTRIPDDDDGAGGCDGDDDNNVDDDGRGRDGDPGEHQHHGAEHEHQHDGSEYQHADTTDQSGDGNTSGDRDWDGWGRDEYGGRGGDKYTTDAGAAENGSWPADRDR